MSGAALAAREAFRPNWAARAGLVALAAYAVYAMGRLDITWARLVTGFGEAGRFLGRMWPPNFERWELLVEGMLESIQIAVLSSALAILFVKALGFGALAGVAALTIASMGFIAKLFAEAIEEISMKQVEAIRATGAGLGAVLMYGVLPQVASRFVGFCLYQLDSNLRNSTLVGIVGAGGIGGTLFAAFKRFDYDFVAAILLSIIALIFLAEVVSGRIRAAMR